MDTIEFLGKWKYTKNDPKRVHIFGDAIQSELKIEFKKSQLIWISIPNNLNATVKIYEWRKGIENFELKARKSIIYYSLYSGMMNMLLPIVFCTMVHHSIYSVGQNFDPGNELSLIMPIHYHVISHMITKCMITALDFDDKKFLSNHL